MARDLVTIPAVGDGTRRADFLRLLNNDVINSIPIDDSGDLRFPASTELTIATGAITPTQNYHRVDTQGDAATDDLDTIGTTNVAAGFVLLLQPENVARVVTLTAVGNIRVGNTCVLDALHKTVALYYDGTYWRPLGRSDGKVVQVVAGSYSTLASNNTNVYADTGLTLTITMRNSANKVRVDVHMAGCGKDTGDTYLKLKLLRGAVDLIEFEKGAGYTASPATNYVGGCGCTYIDTPGGAGVHTYKVQLASASGIAAAFCQVLSSMSTITLTEFEP